VGSTISEPNLYFRQTSRADQPVAFDVVDLSGGEFGWPGELRGVAAVNGIVVVGGVDENSDEGVFYRIGGDSIDTFYVDDFVPDLRASTVRGVCGAANHFVIVGEEPVNDGVGFVLHSADGLVWEDITMPENPGPLSRCVINGSTLYAAGAGGYVAAFGL
jgi:hypothetical protein